MKQIEETKPEGLVSTYIKTAEDDMHDEDIDDPQSLGVGAYTQIVKKSILSI